MSNATVPTADLVLVSEHAGERYRHRIQPGLALDAARRELEQVAATGEVSAAPPEWASPKDPPRYWLTVDDAIVLPLQPHRGRWIGSTCIAQQTLTPTRRDRKSARKASLAGRKRARRRTRF